MKRKILITFIILVVFSFVYPFFFVKAEPTASKVEELEAAITETTELIKNVTNQRYKIANSTNDATIDEKMIPSALYAEAVTDARRTITTANGLIQKAKSASQEERDSVTDEELDELLAYFLNYKTNVYPFVELTATFGTLDFEKDLREMVAAYEHEIEIGLIVINSLEINVSRAKRFLNQTNYDKLQELIRKTKQFLAKDDITQRKCESEISSFNMALMPLELKWGSKNHKTDLEKLITEATKELDKVLIRENGDNIFSDTKWITQLEKEQYETILSEYNEKLLNLQLQEEQLRAENKSSNYLDLEYIESISQLRSYYSNFRYVVCKPGNKKEVTRDELSNYLQEIEHKVNGVKVIDSKKDLDKARRETLFVEEQHKNAMSQVVLSTKEIINNTNACEADLKTAYANLEQAYSAFQENQQTGNVSLSLKIKHQGLIITAVVFLVIIGVVVPWIPLMIKDYKQRKAMKAAKKEAASMEEQS